MVEIRRSDLDPVALTAELEVAEDEDRKSWLRAVLHRLGFRPGGE